MKSTIETILDEIDAALTESGVEMIPEKYKDLSADYWLGDLERYGPTDDLMARIDARIASERGRVSRAVLVA